MMSSEQIRLTEEESKDMARFILNTENTGTIRICATEEKIQVFNESGQIYTDSRVSNMKRIRDMNADEIEVYAKTLKDKIGELHGVDNDFREWLECEKIYRQLTNSELIEALS